MIHTHEHSAKELLERILEACAWNYEMSDKYSWNSNYQDNLARRARAHNQAELAAQISNGSRFPTQHIISHYLGAGARISDMFATPANIAFTNESLTKIGLGEHRI